MRRQLFAHLRVLDLLGDLVADEVGRRAVGVLVQQDVVIGQREAETEPLPGGLEDLFPLFGRIVQRGLLVRHEAEATRGVQRPFAALAVMGLDLGILLVADLRVGGGDAEIRGPLEHRQVLRLTRDDRRHLHAGRSCADDADTLAAEVHRLVRPFSAVIDLALEPFLAGKAGEFRRRQLADRHDQEARVPGTPVVGGDSPTGGFFVILGAADAGIQLDVLPEIELVGNVVDVTQHLGLRGVTLAPAPFLLEFFGKHVGVVVALHIAARTGILVVVPDAADVVAGFQHDRGQPHLAQRVQRAQPCEAGPDHDGVKFSCGHIFTRRCVSLWKV